MASRDEILSSVRRHLPQSAELPDLRGDWIQYADPHAHFAAVLESVGGRCEVVENLAALNERLAAIPEYAAASRFVSLVPGAGASSFEFDKVDDPHTLRDVDFAVLPSRLAVAENGAVWMTDEHLKHRVLYFIPQYLAFVVPYDGVVSNMHEAYTRIAQFDPTRFQKPGFSAFISGPSKTADIEQSLVVGAHGARSLTVFLLKNAE